MYGSKISKDAAEAFMNAKKFKRGNIRVEVQPNVTILSLYGNEIAYRYNDPERTLSVTNCGWFTKTTKTYLNAIPGVRVHQKNWDWFLNGQPWGGNLTDVLQESSLCY